MSKGVIYFFYFSILHLWLRNNYGGFTSHSNSILHIRLPRGRAIMLWMKEQIYPEWARGRRPWPRSGSEWEASLSNVLFSHVSITPTGVWLKDKTIFFSTFTMWTLTKTNYFTWKNTNLRNASVYYKTGMTHLGTRSYYSRLLIFSYIFHHS